MCPLRSLELDSWSRAQRARKKCELGYKMLKARGKIALKTLKVTFKRVGVKMLKVTGVPETLHPP